MADTPPSPAVDDDDEPTDGAWHPDRTDAIDSSPFRSGDLRQLKACLVVLAGPDLGRYFELAPASYLIGRAEHADIGLRDLGISRHHARLIHEEIGVFIEDLGSANGLFVNGTRVTQRVALQEGDKLALGRGTILKFGYVDQLDQQFQQDLLNAALRDALTGAFNKRYFIQSLRTEFAYAHRHHTRLGLIMIDLDFFKRINDDYGHLAGDAVLTRFGQIVLNAIRIEDIFARYGGEEFALLCRGNNQTQTAAVAERLRETIEHSGFSFENQRLRVTASIGLAGLPEYPAAEAFELLQAADQALYAAKHGGRNRTCVAAPKPPP